MTDYFPSGLPTPRPVVDPDTQPWWDAAASSDLVIPWCEGCQRLFWYPRGFCPRCGGTALEWRKATGRGVLYSYSIVRRAAEPWGSHTPFVLGYVTLDEGITVQANVVDCSIGELAPGFRVHAVFETNEVGDLPILRFAPSRERAGDE